MRFAATIAAAVLLAACVAAVLLAFAGDGPLAFWRSAPPPGEEQAPAPPQVEIAREDPIPHVNPAPVSPRRIAEQEGPAIRGVVRFAGDPPEPAEITMQGDPKCAALHAGPVFEDRLVVSDDGELANVVISLQAPPGKQLKGAERRAPVVLDQVGCRYVPHVVALTVDQPLLVKNSDPFLHNVHGLPLDNQPFNFAMPTQDLNGRPLRMQIAERFSIKCDVHPWMLAHVNVFEHPFFAVSGEDGRFSIPIEGLQDGSYTLVFWHEQLGEHAQHIQVTRGAAIEIDYTFPLDEAAAHGADMENARGLAAR